MAALTIAAYTALLFFNRPLPFGDAGAAREYLVHVWGMWIGFVLLALLVAHFIVRMGETLRERDRLLAEEREKALRDERLVALGTLAAGTAHELATPLGTLTVLSRDLAEDYVHADPDLVDRLGLLDEQVRRCKEALGTLSASAGEVRAESGTRQALDDFLDGVVAEWQATRPEAGVQCQWSGPQPAPALVGERVLAQALINILNNAADASPEAVTVRGTWDATALTLDVCDRGAGLDERAAAVAGREPVTTKEPGQGLGLGLFLAHAVIGRLGGEVSLFNREGAGTCTRVWLPLNQLGEGERP
jgi:two-component system sensor histidine kinase RegB